MVYMSGPCDSIAQLKDLEGYEGSLEEYFKKFNEVNGGIYNSSSDKLVQYYPHLFCDPPIDMEGAKEAVSIIKAFSEDERKAVRLLQEEEVDLVTQLCLSEIMQEAQEYVKRTRSLLDQPLITTPWKFFNDYVPNVSGIGLVEASTGVVSMVLENSFPYKPLDALSFNMAEVDNYARQIERLKLIKTTNSKGIHAQIRQLEAKLKVHKGEIKRLISKRLDSKMRSNLGKKFTFEEMRKIRNGTYAKKLARKGAKSGNVKIQARTSVSELQFLSRGGLEKFRKGLKFVKGLGKYTKRGGIIVSALVVTYDTAAVYKETNSEGEAFRTFVGGVAGFGTGAATGWAASSLTAIGIGA